MSKTKMISMVVAVVMVLVVVGGVTAYTNVFAQAGTATPAVPSIAGSTQTPNGQAPANPQPGGANQPNGNPGDLHDAQLASALGITLQQLQTAFQAANSEALKQAVSQGLMTQAQADQITSNGVPNRPLHELGKPGSSSLDYDALLANALGISKETLQAAELKVRNAELDAAVQAGRLTQAQADEMKAHDALMTNAKFQGSMKSAFQTALQQAVTDGVITQAQADQILKDSPNGFMGGGPGGFGGPDGRGGPGMGRPGGAGGKNGNPYNGSQGQPGSQNQ